LQDVLLNPVTAVIMEFPQYFRPAAVRVEAQLEPVEKLQKIVVGLFIIVLCRTTVTFHAALLLREMHGDVILHETHELKAKFHILPAGIGDAGQALQLVDVINQRLVLGINQRMSGFKFFGPLQHIWFTARLWGKIQLKVGLKRCPCPTSCCHFNDKICAAGPALQRKKWRGFGRIIPEIFIDRGSFPAKISHRYKEIVSRKNITNKLWLLK
jgi:hypothetical protein